MMKDLKRVVVLVTALLVPASSALPQGGPGWGWRYGPRAYGYSSGTTDVDRSKVDAVAKETLSKAIKGQTWATPAGVKHTPLLVDNQVVGQLWEDSDPKTLIMGSFWAGPWGTNVELVKDGKVVGMVWVKVPGGG
jgi:hypothetical protein